MDSLIEGRLISTISVCINAFVANLRVIITVLDYNATILGTL
jgi:hypothetical protein